MISTEDEPFPVLVTFIVPAFEVAVAMWRNKDPEKAYPLFRQFKFIVARDQEKELTDKMLAGYLYTSPGADEAIFTAFCKYVKEGILANQVSFHQISAVIH